MTTMKNVDAKELEDFHARIRQALPPEKQGEVFRLAAEAGYLAALADGNEDDEERATLVQSIEQLSKGLVIEWEVEQYLETTWARIQKDGIDTCAAEIGTKLKELDAAEAGLFIAAVVALATAGLDKSEAEMLQTIGEGAGVPKSEVANIVKRAK